MCTDSSSKTVLGPRYKRAWRFLGHGHVWGFSSIGSHVIDRDNVGKLPSVPLISSLTGGTADLVWDQLYVYRQLRSDLRYAGRGCFFFWWIRSKRSIAVKWSQGKTEKQKQQQQKEHNTDAYACWVQIRVPSKFCGTQTNSKFIRDAKKKKNRLFIIHYEKVPKTVA